MIINLAVRRAGLRKKLVPAFTRLTAVATKLRVEERESDAGRRLQDKKWFQLKLGKAIIHFAMKITAALNSIPSRRFFVRIASYFFLPTLPSSPSFPLRIFRLLRHFTLFWLALIKIWFMFSPFLIPVMKHRKQIMIYSIRYFDSRLLYAFRLSSSHFVLFS